jgi:sugar phosphate isomerase/epimerase
MLLALPGNPHLTYCTNIHAGETWAEIEASVTKHVPEVKRMVSPGAPMGIGLRLSGAAAAELIQPARLAAFADFLAAHSLYVFTVNAFPYGAFHGRAVKEKVYEPDWREDERLAFTNRCADILAALLPVGLNGSISTVPGAFKAKVNGASDVTRMAGQMISHAAHLHGIAVRTGKTITLALEPEPCCFLETTEEAIAFFERELLGPDAVELMTRLTGLPADEAGAALRRHLGLCFDVCHAAVQFEDISGSLDRVQRSGIMIAKLQLSSAINVSPVNGSTERLLAPFDDGIYLHQTVERWAGGLTRHIDLDRAFAALRRGESGGEWRVHCHVPVFLEEFTGLGSTQGALKDALAICREREVSPHLEIETYTWSVLPSALRNGDLAADIAREVEWVRSQLRA